MQVLLILGLSSLLLSLVFTPFVGNLFRRLGLVDHPDSARKLHAHPIPNMGGIPIVLAYLASFAVLILVGKFKSLHVDASLAMRIAPGAAVIFITGLLDDRLRLSPRKKLAAQVFAAGSVFIAGVHVGGIAYHQLPSWLSLPVTLVWLVACTNAFNLIDGVDGLAAGLGLVATATTLVASLIQRNFGLSIATAPLVGALLGFLRYNFNPASIYLGDSGSLTIGFILGCYGIIWSDKSATLFGMTAPLMALGIPILEVCLSIARRFLRRQPIFGADRGHIHHRLLDRGFSTRRVALVLYGICGIGAVFSLFQSVAADEYALAIIISFCGMTWLGVRNLGYAEFGQARRIILGGGFRRILNAQLSLRTFRDSLSTAKTQQECWEILRQTCVQFGFSEIHWWVGEEVYREVAGEHRTDCQWMLQIPLGCDDHVELCRSPGSELQPLDIGAFAEALHGSLASRTWHAAPRAARAIAVGQLQQSLVTSDGSH
jgi:UDP-GlcNAc:undecaprenyl-phosphate GlcNAc-1-phosphate transferase